MTAWAEVDAWKEHALKRRLDLNLDLFRMEWVPLATNDGTYAARRVRHGDPTERLYWDGEPEATGHTPEILLATVRALHAEDVAERKQLAPWHCSGCGHEHAAHLGNICIGCPCERRSRPDAPKKAVVS